MHLHRDTGQILVIDTQERLLPRIADPARVAAAIARVVAYGRRLGVPISLAEHYPQGLGRSVAPLREIADHSDQQIACIEKITFSCWREPRLRDRIGSLVRERRRQIVVAGLETHVCVLQSVLDLLAADLDVYLVADATGSRDSQDRDLALERMRRAGAAIVTSEMVAFEWLERADTPEFRDLLPVIRDRA